MKAGVGRSKDEVHGGTATTGGPREGGEHRTRTEKNDRPWRGNQTHRESSREAEQANVAGTVG